MGRDDRYYYTCEGTAASRLAEPRTPWIYSGECQKVVPNPKIRRWFAAAFRSAQHTPMMHGLIEVDVTRARAFLRKHKAKTGESLSFTAFLIACLGKAVDENKAVQALRKGNKRLVLFEDVDVYTLIERNVAGQKQIIPYTMSRPTYFWLLYQRYEWVPNRFYVHLLSTDCTP